MKRIKVVLAQGSLLPVIEPGLYYYRNSSSPLESINDLFSNKIDISESDSATLEDGIYELYGPIPEEHVYVNIEGVFSFYTKDEDTIFDEIKKLNKCPNYSDGYLLTRLNELKYFLENSTQLDDLRTFLYSFILYVSKYEGLVFSSVYFFDSISVDFLESLKNIYQPNKKKLLAYHDSPKSKETIDLILHRTDKGDAPFLFIYPTIKEIERLSHEVENAIYKHKFNYKRKLQKHWDKFVLKHRSIFILIAHGVNKTGEIELKDEDGNIVLLKSKKLVKSLFAHENINGVILLNCYNKGTNFEIPKDRFLIFNDDHKTLIPGSIELFIYHFLLEFSLTIHLKHSFDYSKRLARFFGNQAKSLKLLIGGTNECN